MGDNTSQELWIPAPQLNISPEAMQSRVLSRRYQDGVASTQGDLTHDSQDPPYISSMEHFEGLSHEEIHNNVKVMNIGAITELGKKWIDIADAMSAKSLGSRLAMHRALSDGFSGEFAAAAEAAADRFFDGVENLQRVVRAVGYRIESVAHGADVVKKSVPPPPTRVASTDGKSDKAEQITQIIVGATSPSDSAAFERQKEEMRQVAIGVMNSVYKPTYQPAGEGVPTFVPVSAPGDDPTGSVPGTTGPSPSGPGSNVPGSTTGTPTTTSPGQPNSQQTGIEDPQTVAANTTQAGTTGQSPTTQTGTSPGTTPSDTPRGIPTGTPTVTGTPSRPGIPSRPGVPGRTGTPQVPAPGRSVPGAPGIPGANTPAAAAASRTARPMGMSGMPGMMSPGGARRGGDDESERKTPDYLIGDRQEELFGPPQRTVPPALGADAPAANPASTDDDFYR
ncbi:hypothetical protein [Nocardia paucivorans]|uniref:hypothetical protein n=1 Tax=Nocardia paucivorans TaxID=114259 RepID=UPI000310C699|nr:hypothetical protein [Nocardia paucivorans]